VKLLLELINTAIKRVNTKHIPSDTGRHSRGTQSQKSTTIGTGAYASVERHDNLPQGSVVKYGKVVGDIKQDGYVNFLTQISKSDRMARNPYLPRIYSVRIISKIQYAVVMEELVSVGTLNRRELEAMIKRMFGGTLRDLAKLLPAAMGDRINKYRKDRSISDATARIFELRSYIETFPFVINRMVRGIISLDHVADPKLKEAIMVIKKIHRLKGGHADVHASNVMVRRGPTGAQLVITDPLRS
jgi:hypothetical protein